MSIAPALVKRAAAADFLGISERTLKRYDREGSGPGFVRVGPKMVRYDLEACRAWATARAFPHRAAEMARGTHPGKEKAPVTG